MKVTALLMSYVALLLVVTGSSVWAASSDVDTGIPLKNALSEQKEESDGIKPQTTDRRSDLDDVDFSSFFDMDLDEDNEKDDLDKAGSLKKQESSPPSVADSESETNKNSTPGIQNQVVVGPYQISVVDSRSPLLSSLGLRRKHLQHLTSSAYSPYSRRRSSYSSRYYPRHAYHTSESVRSSNYAEYPSQHPPSYEHSRPPPPPPNSYPMDRNKEYVPMGGHYRGNDRELHPQEHPDPYAQEKAYPPNSVDHPPPPHGAYKPNYAPPPHPPPPPSNPIPHDQQQPVDAYRGGHYVNGNFDPKQQTPKRGPYNYQEPGEQHDDRDRKENYDQNYNRALWKQSNQYPLHPAPLSNRAPTHSSPPSPSSYSQHKPYSPPSSSSPPRTHEKTSYSSSYSRPQDASHSYSKPQYGSAPASESRPYHSHPPPNQHRYSYHSPPPAPKPKTPHRAGSVSSYSDGSYHTYQHSPSPSKPVITVKFKARAPDGGHGLSIPLNFSPLEVMKKLATPLSVLNPLANKKVTIGITIEQKDKHPASSELLHSF